jgi:hypothetical protein
MVVVGATLAVFLPGCSSDDGHASRPTARPEAAEKRSSTPGEDTTDDYYGRVRVKKEKPGTFLYRLVRRVKARYGYAFKPVKGQYAKCIGYEVGLFASQEVAVVDHCPGGQLSVDYASAPSAIRLSGTRTSVASDIEREAEKFGFKRCKDRFCLSERVTPRR